MCNSFAGFAPATSQSCDEASSELEIYPMLIEKAVAVMIGGFDKMNAIMPTWAFGVLTGQTDVWHFTGQAGCSTKCNTC
eukprot:4959688-Amphidinium_carterae.1